MIAHRKGGDIMKESEHIVRTVGDCIRDMRKSSGMTQAELAKKVGLSTITIRQYESNAREPRFTTLQSIATALECEVSVLLPTPNENPMYFRKIRDNLTEEEILDLKDVDNLSNPEYQKEKIILRLFRKLNSNGKQTAIWRVEELTQLPQYQEVSSESIQNQIGPTGSVQK